MEEKVFRTIQRCSVLCCLLMLIGVGSVQATPVLIDGFEQDQSFSANGVGPPVTDTETDDGADDILGDSRLSSIEILADLLGGPNATVDESGGAMAINNGPLVDSEVKLTWDDNFTADLKDGDSNEGIGVEISFTDSALNMQLDVTDSSSNTGFQSLSSPVIGLSDPAEILFFNFNGFSGTIDFAFVTSIILTVNGNTSWDATFNFINASPEPDPIPEPGTLALFACCGIGMLGYAWRRRKQEV